ncbi:23S rRNA m(6)A-1618 methyltransferase [Psychromonas ingrahamii 37]|uniref:Ribosomal RNA large subunit methyltransferase F n=1 Tax=Psychromonas ingrahamii (strain DSM 17664 / CCUG 51855 / 37) TaxID=357804 RepID=RLMF_PSYIN|nr:23S rRNA (adenine(1618)-N(6))-methyltransferase RlmF [Psychromonas ingrahamii]A1SSI8.1 RecName: Full=Ribosomal RNA large subunit methyltransferase F; AltName: Full=23S rRNA mA1618 methyltransferase; AltName: Full=rRNA adenine N-6-methyltransferase [Psychromonas ingrahamii 37]ABM02453.1 23S rRNA m(6)A-1618 methyltransferase [Psychromonas ingrahamii 37]
MTKDIQVKKLLHPRNLHRGHYDLKQLCEQSPLLSTFLRTNPKGEQTLDFAEPQAVLLLNQVLLKQFYHVDFWQIPKGYLCPPIPGRVDYIHYLADLLGDTFHGKIPEGKQVKVLDIGTGANCIYPILGSQSYGWSFVGTDIDPLSVKMAGLIIKSNVSLKPFIKVQLQANKQAIFAGIIKPKDKFTLTMCNPPFHASMEKALAGSARKIKNLSNDQNNLSRVLNFAGQEGELCCAGGEIRFLKQMIQESKDYARQVCWFTSLVSKSDNIAPLKQQLEKVGAEHVKVIKMAQGQKVSRFIAWSFLPQPQNF